MEWNSNQQHERRGLILQERFLIRLGDALQFRARLSRPAYCYWLAFRPDGVVELCYPAKPDEPPDLTDEPQYPIRSEDQIVYGLTDGEGWQAFVLLASEKPLPAYNEWISRVGPAPWEPARGTPA